MLAKLGGLVAWGHTVLRGVPGELGGGARGIDGTSALVLPVHGALEGPALHDGRHGERRQGSPVFSAPSKAVSLPHEQSLGRSVVMWQRRAGLGSGVERHLP